jgi:transposase
MLTLPSSLRVFANTGPTDMRESFEGLVGVVERELGQQVESGHLFPFFNRRGDRVKVLWFAAITPGDTVALEALLPDR